MVLRGEWPTPAYVTDVRAFLGFCNYYRKFINRYIDISRPLNKLLCKDTDLEWGKEQTTAFRQLKEALTQAPVLAFAQETGTFILDTEKVSVRHWWCLVTAANGTGKD